MIKRLVAVRSVFKITGRLTILALTLLVIFGVLGSNAKAHSGRTDSSGGHNCYVGSCAGTYHYHSGSGYSVPVTPNYISQGTTNGKAHAARDITDIQSNTRKEGYQSGYSAGLSGATQNNYLSVPDYICNKLFTFDAGTNETYKTWYQTSYRSACNDTATGVYKASYDAGYAAGLAAKPKPTIESASQSKGEEGEDSWLGWLLLGSFVGLPLVAISWDSIKKYF